MGLNIALRVREIVAQLSLKRGLLDNGRSFSRTRNRYKCRLIPEFAALNLCLGEMAAFDQTKVILGPTY